MTTLDQLISSLHRDAEENLLNPKDLDLLLYAPCPVKLAVKERIDAIAADLDSAGNQVNIHIPMGCTSVDPYDPLHLETDPECLPGIIASIGFGDFFRRGFSDRFVETGVFEAILPEYVHPLHEKSGIIDPDGQYLVYGLTPYIFLVDTRKLGDCPLPCCWEDLQNPAYRGQINMCGDGDDMADAVLLHYYKDFGMGGLTAFAANCRGLMHSSRMGKPGGVSSGGAIYIIPYFFAESSRQPDHMQVIWPEDGAAASPLYMLATQKDRDRLMPLIRFFTEEFGQIDSARWFLPLSGPLPESLPEKATLNWPGWTFIKEQDITALRDELNYRFRELVAEAPCA